MITSERNVADLISNAALDSAIVEEFINVYIFSVYFKVYKILMK